MAHTDSTRTATARTATRARQQARAVKRSAGYRPLDLATLTAELHAEQADRAEFLADYRAGALPLDLTPRERGWIAAEDARVRADRARAERDAAAYSPAAMYDLAYV